MVKLERIQWKCIRIALGAFPSTPTNALEVIANIPPLKERLCLAAKGYANQLLSFNSHPLVPHLEKLRSSSRSLPHFFEICLQKKDQVKFRTLNPHPMFSCSYESLSFRPTILFLKVKKNACSNETVSLKFNNFNSNHWAEFVKIYTDGSKTVSHTGFGVWIPYLNLEAHFDIRHDASIFTAEGEAILEALHIAHVQTERKILIITDSMSVLMALKNFPKSRSHPVIFEIRELTWKLVKSGFTIRFLWVPSHKGLVGNEIADRVASDFSDSVIPHDYRLFARDLRASDKSLHYGSWQNKWMASSKGRHLFQFLADVNKDPWFIDMALPRFALVMLNRLLTSHTRCKSHLCKINMSSDDVCSCGQVQNPEHLLFDCTEIDSRIRAKFFDIVRSEGQTPRNLTYLLSTFNKRIFFAIANFFKSANFQL